MHHHDLKVMVRKGARFLDVKKTYVFWMIDMLCMIDTRNFFLKRNFCTEVCLLEQTSCAQSVDYILKNVVSSKTTVFECAQKSLIFDIGRHYRHKTLKVYDALKRQLQIYM